MAASVQDISSWFDFGIKRGAKYMIVWCDIYDWSDYPKYYSTYEEAKADSLKTGQNMQRLMESYDLGGDKKRQLSLRRCHVL